MHATLPLLRGTDFPAIQRRTLDTLQVNLGYRCNQACLHCHVNAGPTRTETMSSDTIGFVLDYLRQAQVKTLDLTGGAPELHPEFRTLVERARAQGVQVIDRCNLTILEEPGQESLGQFLADQGVDITASLPCYLEDNVDRQRGKGVYGSSIRGLQQLNALGYGRPGSGLSLNLVFNPQGPVLPPPQAALEADYKAYLKREFGIEFNQLFTLANMPIQRFGSTLVSKGTFSSYMKLLKSAHRDANLETVMCRSTLSVDYLGYVYDCDFNQMLGLPLMIAGKPKRHLRDLLTEDLAGLPITVADHCFGCTAGQGSSCTGALSPVAESAEHRA
jgi:radical SAM/Cys-rich protein